MPSPPKPSPHLRQLRYFVVVAEELHFGRAAERLHLTQPSLSDAVRRLESSIGVQLLDRSSRHVALTPAGEDFLPRARSILADFDAATAAARQIAAGEAGPLRIGYSPGARMMFEPTVRGFNETYPEVVISAREMLTIELIDDVRDRRVDAAFTFLGRRVDGLSYRAIKHMDLYAAVSSKCDVAGRDRIALADLSEERLLVSDRKLAPGFLDFVIDLCRNAGFEPKLEQLHQPLDRGMTQVATGKGFAIMPADYVSQRLAPEGVALLPLAEAATMPLELVWRDGDAGSSATRFIEFVIEHVASGDGAGRA